MGADRFSRDLAVFRQQGVGHPLGKGGVWCVVNLDELKRQMALHAVQHRPGAAVAGVDHHLQRLQDLKVHITEEMGRVSRKGVGGLPQPFSFLRRGNFWARHQRGDILKTAVAT
jgi:hypothetical protein